MSDAFNFCQFLDGTDTPAYSPQSKLVIIEVISSTCTTLSTSMPPDGAVTLDDLRGVKEHRAVTPPAFIPANFGANAKMSLALGVHMMGVFNALERSMVRSVCS